MTGTIRKIELEGLSNAEFFERHAAPGRVGLVGGESLVEKAIRRAQRRQTEDRRWSHWGHVFLFEGRRADGQHWVLESDLDPHRERTQLGVQENPIAKYLDEKSYPYLAILDFGVQEAQVQAMLGEGLRMLADRTQYSLREIMALYWKLKRPDQRSGDNVFDRGEDAIFCSAFVQHLFLKIGIDFAPEVSTKLTTPEDIAQTQVPHTAYLLLRGKS
jgi:hypothetical protein